MEAAGMYLRALREGKKLSRIDAASQLATNEMQIIRIEKGEVDTRSSFLMKFLRLVSGSPEHLSRLILDDTATAEDGKQLAATWLTHNEIAMIDAIPDECLHEALAILDEIQKKDDAALVTVVKMLRGLVGR